MHLCARIGFIAPAEKREELVAILDDLIRRLRKIINSTRTKTPVRLRAVEVLAELVRTSYTMVRDVEVEKLERETESLEKEAKRTERENKTKTEPAKSA
jgi:polyhydroxyalkanoate synthesis regulator phasin